MHGRNLSRFALLSIAAAIMTIGLKTGAYLLTGSVGLLSDAMESGVNLIAAIVAFGALTIVARPADKEHEFGHDKVEYFSSGVEGALILVAAASIAWTSIERLLNPKPIEQVGIGLAVSVVASVINYFVARVLRNAGRTYNSITLEADSRHLMTDVWTSVGIVIAVALVAITKWEWLDPVIALAVALNIVLSGVSLVKRSMLGLIDTAIPDEEREKVEAVFAPYREQGIQFHALRTRQAGARRFIAVHVLVPGEWTVKRGHDLLEQIEKAIRGQLENTTLNTHLEPVEDPVALADNTLDRRD